MYKYVYPQAPTNDKAVHLNQNCMQFLTKCTKFLPDYILINPTNSIYGQKFINAQQAKNNPLLQGHKNTNYLVHNYNEAKLPTCALRGL